MAITYEQLRKILGRPVAYYSTFAKVAGGATAGLMLSQIWYWSDERRAGVDGWFYKSRDQWTEETGMTRPEQEAAREILRSRGLIEEIRKGNPYRLYYRLNKSTLMEAINNPDDFVAQFEKPANKQRTEKARLTKAEKLAAKKAAELLNGQTDGCQTTDQPDVAQPTLSSEITTETTSESKDLSVDASIDGEVSVQPDQETSPKEEETPPATPSTSDTSQPKQKPSAKKSKASGLTPEQSALHTKLMKWEKDRMGVSGGAKSGVQLAALIRNGCTEEMAIEIFEHQLTAGKVEAVTWATVAMAFSTYRQRISGNVKPHAAIPNGQSRSNSKAAQTMANIDAVFGAIESKMKK